jgi:hypothetical protein
MKKSAKTPQKKNKTKQPAKAAPVKKPITGLIHSKFAHKICGLTDPFCPHAMGAKYPDDSSNRTLPLTHRSMFTLTTDGNGQVAAIWSPSWSNEPIAHPSARTGSTVTAWAPFDAQGLLSGVVKYRIVSSGFILRGVSAPLYTQGTLFLRSYAADRSALTPVELTSFNATYTKSTPLRDIHEVSFVTQHNSALPQTFYGISSTAVGYNPATIFVTGGPANTEVLTLEAVVHYELIFDDSEGMAQVATPSPPANSLLTSAASKVTSTMAPYFERGVLAASEYVAKRAMNAIATAVGGPALGASMMLLDH